MILRREGDRVLGITQTAHSALTGRLAEAWRPRDDLPWAELCTAAAIHDLGWAQWELAPQINPDTGLPYAFYEVPDRAYGEIWLRGIGEALSFGRLVGLLVSRHFTHLAGRRVGIAGLVAREQARQGELGAELGLGADVLDPCTAQLARWDRLSLDLCGGKDLDLGDWPFVPDRLVLRFDARELPAGGPETVELVLER